LTKRLRPEDELILCCARTSIDANRAAQIRALLREDLDWAHLIEIASLNRVMPLLYRSLRATCPEAVPGAVMELLRDQFEANTRYNLFLTAELLKLLDLLETHGIPALPFKGPVLAASVYGDLSLRQFGDLDILVQEHNLHRAKDLLASQGYQPLPAGYQIQLTGAQEVAYLRTACDYTFVPPDGRVNVELHWKFAPKFFTFPFDLESLWECLEALSLGGKMILNLPPEDLILILCMHGTKHLWKRLAWICDVAELVRVQQDMDWKRVIEQASRLGSKRMLLLGLCLAHDLLDTALPNGIVQVMQADIVVSSLVRKVRERLFQEVDGPFEEEWPYMQLFHLRARERLHDRIQYCLYWTMMPTVTEWDYLRLPASLAFFYHLVHPIRVVKKCGQGLLKQLL
jgi:hypothetical protein